MNTVTQKMELGTTQAPSDLLVFKSNTKHTLCLGEKEQGKH